MGQDAQERKHRWKQIHRERATIWKRSGHARFFDNRIRYRQESFDDESLCSEGVAIESLGDGKSLLKTPFFKNGELQKIEKDITGVQKLTIKTMPKESINCAHVDILNPVLMP